MSKNSGWAGLAALLMACGGDDPVDLFGGSSTPSEGADSGVTSATGGASAGGAASSGGAMAAGGAESPPDAGAHEDGGDAPVATGGAPAGTGGASTGGVAAGGAETGGTASTGGADGAGGSEPVDPLEPYPAPDCPGYTAYFVPEGGCLWIHGRFFAQAPGFCEPGSDGRVDTCAIASSVKPEGAVIYVKAEEGRAFAVDRINLQGLACAEKCDNL